MTLQPGTRLGPYEILAAIGAGGMGEVYRARDTKLGREVALKTVAEGVTHDPDRVARFHREALLLAALNHPHIAAIYGLEEAQGTQILVMELVEGETLAERLKMGALQVPEALRIARQVADALQAAHDKGIIHRDLKPANIALTADGQVKVLDFGLAKALEAASGADVSASPTLSFAATQMGVVLGTAAYMSPEQARGKPADKRSDVWAFGCVLYEMLAGMRTFDGEDIAVVLASVIKGEPDWAALPGSLPTPIATLVRGCLEKDRRNRVADIGAAIFVLDHATTLVERVVERVEVPALTPALRTVVRPPLWQRAIPLAGALIVGLLTGGGVWWAMRSDPPRVVRTEVTTSGATALAVNGTDRDIAITPDGSRIVYRGNNQLLVRALDQLQPTVLAGLDGPRGVFVSPDGQWIGFADNASGLKKVAITGGPPVTITRTDGNGIRGATWGPDGTIVYATNAPGTGLQQVAAAGGDATVLTKPNRERGEADHVWPEFLPGGRAVLFTISGTGGTAASDSSQIAVFNLESKTYKVLVRGGSHAHYLRTGHLVYGVGGTLRAVPFDIDRLAVTGTPAPVLEDVAMTGFGSVDADVAVDGTMVYVRGSGGAGATRSLVWVDRTGREEPLSAPARAYVYPRISPDGKRLGLQIADQDFDIWTWDFARETLTRLTLSPGLERYSVWTPDGRRIVFTSEMVGALNLYWQAADGTGPVERLTESPNPQYPMSFSPDGKQLVFYEQSPGTSNDVMLLAMDGERRVSPLIRTKFIEMNAELSPDGHWIAYQSDESGRDEIYVRPFPNVNEGRWQVSTGGGTRPLWARRGDELFYLSTAGAVMRVAIERGSQFAFTTPTMLFKGQYFTGTNVGGGSPGRTYDISPDGRRFLMIKESATSEAAPQNLVVVQNWFTELQQRVPTRPGSRN